MAILYPSIPTDRPVWFGEIATYWFEGDILVSLSNSTKRTVELIRANVELVKHITGNKQVPLLIYLKNSPVPDKATRVFSTQQLPVIYSKMAMVAPSSLTVLIMNILFKFKLAPIPIKSFDNSADAMQWLQLK